MNWLEVALADGPFVADGAMGTMLIKAGLKPGACTDLWNVDQPRAVRNVLARYADAGSQWVTANTFGGSLSGLARHGLSDRLSELNHAAIAIAKEAAGGRARVMGDIGPFGDFLEPYGETTVVELRRMLEIQIAALFDAGADGIAIETMVDPVELTLAVQVARQISDWPVTATYAFQRSNDTFRTMMGTTVAEAVCAAIQAGAQAVGANCGTNLTLDDYLALAKEIVACSGSTVVILQPNAGAPQQVDGDFVYGASPEDLASWAQDAIAAGVRIVGGCCGTTPEHIRAIVGRVRESA